MIRLVLVLFSKLCAALPWRVLHGLSVVLGWVVGRLIRHRRPYVLDTLARCFPERTKRDHRRIANQMYQSLAANLLEIARLGGGRAEELQTRATMEGRHHLTDALSAGRGAIALVAHIGNWDLMAMAATRFGIPLTFISKAIRNPAVNAFWMRLREQFGVRILPSHNSYRACLKVLRRNEVLGFILDVNRPRDAAVFVDFFGRPAATSPGLALMAAQSGAPVLPVFIERIAPGRHVVHVHPALPPPAGRDLESVRAATQMYTRVIEDEVRRVPGQWLWLHKRWKTQPLP